MIMLNSDLNGVDLYSEKETFRGGNVQSDVPIT